MEILAHWRAFLRLLLILLAVMHICSAMSVMGIRRQPRFPRIPTGATCNSDADCGHSKCCAKHFGRPVCRERPLQGGLCYLSNAGPNSGAFMTTCPCAEGLSCFARPGLNRGLCFTE